MLSESLLWTKPNLNHEVRKSIDLVLLQDSPENDFLNLTFRDVNIREILLSESEEWIVVLIIIFFSILSTFDQTAHLRPHRGILSPVQHQRSSDVCSTFSFSDRLSHQARISASVNAMKILNTGTDVEAAVADALVRTEVENVCK